MGIQNIEGPNYMSEMGEFKKFLKTRNMLGLYFLKEDFTTHQIKLLPRLLFIQLF